jgi:CRP/FNR family transcriptional activator FtrB
MRLDDVTVIREISLFSTMSDEHFGTLIKRSYLQHFPDQIQLTTEGESADFLYIVLEGTIELFSKSNDRDATLFVAKPVSAFNLSAVLRKDVYLMSSRTLGEALILMIPAENVCKVMDLDVAFAHAMVMELAKRYRVAIQTYKEQRLRNGVERLANYLLRANDQATKRGQFELAEDKRTLAALLGMTPESLSRAFGTLKKYGVKVQGKKISLTKPSKLNKLAKPNPLIDSRAI